MPKMGYLTIPEVSELTGLTPNTLYWYRHTNSGPPCYRLGKRILYPVVEFEQWLAARRSATIRGQLVG
jgi:predicted DNA-binding transcriptional regulator AlpA